MSSGSSSAHIPCPTHVVQLTTNRVFHRHPPGAGVASTRVVCIAGATRRAGDLDLVGEHGEARRHEARWRRRDACMRRGH